MKLTIILLFLTMMQVSAASFAQKLSLKKNGVTLKQVFKEIKKQTGYDVLYQPQKLKDSQKIDVDFNGTPLAQVMKECLKMQGLEYTLYENAIVIREEQPIVNKQAEVAAKLVTITGKVTDTTGMPLPGATIKIKGGNQATSADIDGSFTLKNVDENSTLQVSSIGYVPQEVKLRGATNLIIKLKTQSSALNEVVVVGYSTQTRENLIGSVAQVSGKDINNRTAPSLSSILTGQLAGVNIIQSSGQPGFSGSGFQIRGVGSFGASTSPLILVDGIPVNSFDDINPSEVASVSVLKDASTAAIYGSRGANGVVLVTTKSGQSSDGKLHIDYSGYVGVQKATAYPQNVNSAEYATLLNEAVPNSYTAAQIQAFGNGSDPDNYPNTDWVKLLFKKSVLQTGHDLSLSNNTKNSRYLLSFGYLDQDGIVAKNNYKRYNMRLNMENNISKNLTLTSRVSAAQYYDTEPYSPATLGYTLTTLIGEVVRTPAIYANVLSNGSYGAGLVGKGTPYSYLNNDSFLKGLRTDLLINERLDYTIIPGLKVSAIAAYTTLYQNNVAFSANQVINSTVTLGPGTLAQNNNTTTYKTLQELVEYKKSIDESQFGILIGHTYEYNKLTSLNANRGGYYSNTLTQLVDGDASTQTNTGSASESALDSYFGRINYTYANKYLVEGDLRYDGSSMFPPQNKYALFPAVAVGWRVSQESFLKDKFSWLNDFKIKASYGILGNQNIGNYAYQSVLNIGTPTNSSAYNYSFGNSVSTGVATTNVVDPDLKWESTRTEDIGFETTLFKNLNFTASYFSKYTYNILVSPAASVSSVLGFGVGVQNSGKLSNKGFEFTLAYKNHIGQVGYNVSGNFSTLTNKVLDLGVGNVKQPNGLVGNGSTLFIGYPVAMYYGYKTSGLFANTAAVANYANQKIINPSVQAGDIRYADISGPNGVPDGQVDPTYDRTYLGTSIPKFSYGLNIGLNYKSFDLAITGSGVGGSLGQLTQYAGWAFYQNGNVPQFVANNHWSVSNPNPNALYPRLQQIPNTGTGNTLASDFYLHSASYFEIRSIQLGYSFPAGMFSKIGVKGLRVNIAAQNPFIFSKYPAGYDPESTSSANYNPVAANNTAGAYYPILANYTLGVNLSL